MVQSPNVERTTRRFSRVVIVTPKPKTVCTGFSYTLVCLAPMVHCFVSDSLQYAIVVERVINIHSVRGVIVRTQHGILFRLDQRKNCLRTNSPPCLFVLLHKTLSNPNGLPYP